MDRKTITDGLLYFGVWGIVIGLFMSYGHALVLTWAMPLVLAVGEWSSTPFTQQPPPTTELFIAGAKAVTINVISTIGTAIVPVSAATALIVFAFKERRYEYGIVPSLVVVLMGYRLFIIDPKPFLNYWSVEPAHAISFFLIPLLVVGIYFASFWFMSRIAENRRKVPEQ